MPRGGKNRQSGPDEARGSDLAGGLGDEDYDWIRYLGEGRSSSGASSSRASSQSPGPPQRVKRASGPQAYDEPTPDRHPASRDTSGQGVFGRGRPARGAAAAPAAQSIQTGRNTRSDTPISNLSPRIQSRRPTAGWAARPGLAARSSCGRAARAICCSTRPPGTTESRFIRKPTASGRASRNRTGSAPTRKVSGASIRRSLRSRCTHPAMRVQRRIRGRLGPGPPMIRSPIPMRGRSLFQPSAVRPCRQAGPTVARARAAGRCSLGRRT